jgi:hypothetical protein
MQLDNFIDVAQPHRCHNVTGRKRKVRTEDSTLLVELERLLEHDWSLIFHGEPKPMKGC